ncbi:cytoplasmic dynein 1 light intermediate chain 2-like isoform X3 [Argopecten irradians]|uniref:cytoplasmic dynein 1 light intermediate chain 2-like isoform X3 n=1 Tax=Argopecten irradians TaxID=31199 RepID=UPI003710BF80
MAPTGERNENMGAIAGDDDDNEAQNLWATILGEVQSSSASNLPSTKSVLLLGDNESGKTTLVAKLQGVEEPKKGTGLEYYFIDIKDEYRDEKARLGVWVLDGDPSHNGLLKYCVTKDNFEHNLVVLVASMSSPWSIMESLEKWTNVLREHIDRLKLQHEDRREYEESLVRFFQEYTEPEEGQSSQSVAAPRRDVNPLHPSASHTEEDRVLLPLGENTLSQNLGIPIVVVITKTDAISTLEKEHDYREEHFDFIQQHIRKFCLQIGAALVYTSVKEDKNCDLLYRYFEHRIYGFPFSQQAYVVEKDSVFVPTGWDNEKKIKILYENLNSMKAEDCYGEVIVKPMTRKPVQRDAEVIAEDEQVFLVKQQMQLSKQPAPGAAGESPLRPPAAATNKQSPSPRPTTPQASSSPKKLDGKTPQNTSEGMLANFFNSLLNKNTRTPVPTKAGSPPTPSRFAIKTKLHANMEQGSLNSLLNQTRDKAAVTRDATAELERLTRSRKTPEANKTNGPDSSAS